MSNKELTESDLINTLQPALDRATKIGQLIGGELRILEKRTDGKWKPVSVLTVMRKNIAGDEQLPLIQAVPPPSPPELPNLEAVPVESAPTGQICFKCNSPRMQRVGTCEVCLDCGESGGCG